MVSHTTICSSTLHQIWVDGFNINAYNQADTTNSDESLTSYALAFSPEAVDGLTIGFASMDDDSSATTASHVSETQLCMLNMYMVQLH